MPVPQYCNINDLAHLLGMSTRRIQQLQKDGMPKHARGKFDIAACFAFVIDRWRVRAQNGDGASLTNTREKLAAAQTVRCKLETDKIRGDLVPVEDVAQTVNQVAAIIAGQLDGLAGRVGAQMVAVTTTGQAQEIIFRECRSIRESIADAISEYAAAATVSKPDSPAPAKKKRKRVGRAKPNTANGKRRAGAVANR